MGAEKSMAAPRFTTMRHARDDPFLMGEVHVVYRPVAPTPRRGCPRGTPVRSRSDFFLPKSLTASQISGANENRNRPRENEQMFACEVTQEIVAEAARSPVNQLFPPRARLKRLDSPVHQYARERRVFLTRVLQASGLVKSKW